MTKQIAMISKNDCPACKDTKAWFKKWGIEITDFNINTHKDKRQVAEIYRQAGSPGLPLVILDYGKPGAGKVVGNRTDIFKLFIGGRHGTTN